MSRFDWDQVRKAKEKFRAATAAQSFSEKIAVLERLRARDDLFKQMRGQGANIHAGIVSPKLQTASVNTGGSILLTTFGAKPNLIAAAAPTATEAPAMNIKFIQDAK